MKAPFKLSSMTAKPPLCFWARVRSALCTVPPTSKAVPAAFDSSTRVVLHARMIDSPRTMQQRKTKSEREHEDIIIPNATPRWRIMQLEPNGQRYGRENYSVPACANKEGARFVSLFSLRHSGPQTPYVISPFLRDSSPWAPAFGEWDTCCGSLKSCAQL